jgi:hypothetical protein
LRKQGIDIPISPVSPHLLFLSGSRRGVRKGDMEIGEMRGMSLENDALTGRIINAIITVHQELGPGFLEKIYRNALTIQLRKQGIDIPISPVSPHLLSLTASCRTPENCHNVNVFVFVDAVTTTPLHGIMTLKVLARSQ